ncbi:MAG TPA: class I SAM-dependent methyltransferase [Gammaproteobacteria bacterium]|nr:class I SAM-dependent methyltransferase [Gammaproteobacteria bacterium]
MQREAVFQANTIVDQFLLRYRCSRVRQFLRVHPNTQKVLDLGCGKGQLIHWLLKKNLDAYGVDLKAHGNRIIAGNLNKKIPLPDKSFDLVTSLANIEHLEKPEQNLLEIFRILKPGGYLILTTPSLYAKPILEFLAFKLKWIDATEILDHKRYYSKCSLHKALEQAGFTNIRMRYFQMGFNICVWAKKTEE